MFVWHNVVVLYDLGYIVTALDLQCLTIDKNTTKTLQYGLGIHFTLCCIEMWFVVSAAKHPPCFYRLEEQPPCQSHAWEARGRKGCGLLVRGMGVWAGNLMQGSWVHITDLMLQQPSSPIDTTKKAGFHHTARKTKIRQRRRSGIASRLTSRLRDKRIYTLMYLGSCLVLCIIFYPLWIQQCSKSEKPSSHLLTVKSGITRCKIRAEHKPSSLVWAGRSQRRRCLHWENCSAISERSVDAEDLILGLWGRCHPDPLQEQCQTWDISASLTELFHGVLYFSQQNVQCETCHGLKGMMCISLCSSANKPVLKPRVAPLLFRLSKSLLSHITRGVFDTFYNTLEIFALLSGKAGLQILPSLFEINTD